MALRPNADCTREIIDMANISNIGLNPQDEQQDNDSASKALSFVRSS